MSYEIENQPFPFDFTDLPLPWATFLKYCRTFVGNTLFSSSEVVEFLADFRLGDIAMDNTPNIDIVTMMNEYGTEERCRKVLEELRWPKGPECPKCKSKEVARVKDRPTFVCESCQHHFSVTSGTMLHDTHLPLQKWFAAIYLLMESRKGMSANQLKRTLKVGYKTAWYLCHRVRAAIADADLTTLKNIVEVDETYIGGKKRGMGRRYTGNKAIVLAAIQRGGPVRLKVSKQATRKALHDFINAHTSPKTKFIMTDENPAYVGIADHDTDHETVNHSKEEYVRGQVHTNTVEGVFSLFKRSVVGAYHQISAKYLPAYLDEFEFRFGNRKNPYLFRDTLLRLLEAKHVQFDELTKEDAA